MKPETTFIVHLRPLPGVNGIHALRHLLKTSLRKYGLRCLDAREQHDQQATPDRKGPSDADHL